MPRTLWGCYSNCQNTHPNYIPDPWLGLQTTEPTASCMSARTPLIAWYPNAPTITVSMIMFWSYGYQCQCRHYSYIQKSSQLQAFISLAYRLPRKWLKVSWGKNWDNHYIIYLSWCWYVLPPRNSVISLVNRFCIWKLALFQKLNRDHDFILVQPFSSPAPPFWLFSVCTC